MEYRKVPHGEEKVSVIGFGTSSIGMSDREEVDKTLEMAIENGINYFDLASADDAPFSALGRVLGNRRKDVYFQVHFGAEYETGKYGWTTDLETIKRSVDWQLKKLKTDYIDFGFLHCIDETEDLNKALDNGTLKYIQELQAKSIAISVMKAFSGGQLLSDNTSPFGKALTKTQCIQYALDKPAVVTVLPGMRNREDLREILKFNTASREEKDYSVIADFGMSRTEGKCVYCNHCQPCPAGLDVGLINKYYDLTLAGDELAAKHYMSLDKKAGDCISCGHCDSRCPFHVVQIERMQEIQGYFGC